MEVNLYRVSKISWAVATGPNNIEVFSSIEQAADAMMELGVQDEAIDAALIEMHAHSHTRANFGINGGFIFTDGAKYNGLLGVA